MTKTQINIRASAHTKAQLDALAEKLGLNQTEIVLLAIDRLYQREFDTCRVRQAVVNLADRNGITSDLEIVHAAVLRLCKTPTERASDEDPGLYEWLEQREYNPRDTAESLASEWDERVWEENDEE